MLRPWSDRRIEECGEALLPLHPELLCLRPHPYQSLGAPYGEGADPFMVREGVRQRLIAAQQLLRADHPDLRFAIFDAWRPISVQRFMVEHAVAEEAAREGLAPLEPTAQGQLPDPALQAAWDDVRCRVGRFWAPPSDDPATPPPHSTGAAVDLTLADHNGAPLDLGGAIDAIGAVSEPDFYAQAACSGADPLAARFHERRTVLARVLEAQGFCRHPNEWWHFSFGDQLWAWRSGHAQAMYGRCDPSS